MYEKYSAQRDDILARFTEMEKSAESIHELIRNLDKKKDAAIENTFGEVSKHFGEIFEKLVPAGRGRLVMNRRADNAVRARPRPVYSFFVNLQTDLLSPPPRRTSTATRTRTTSGQRSTATLVSRSRLVQLSLTLPVTVRPELTAPLPSRLPGRSRSTRRATRVCVSSSCRAGRRRSSHSRSSSASSAVIRHRSISLTRLTPTSTPSTALRLPVRLAPPRSSDRRSH